MITREQAHTLYERSGWEWMDETRFFSFADFVLYYKHLSYRVTPEFLNSEDLPVIERKLIALRKAYDEGEKP